MFSIAATHAVTLVASHGKGLNSPENNASGAFNTIDHGDGLRLMNRIRFSGDEMELYTALFETITAIIRSILKFGCRKETTIAGMTNSAPQTITDTTGRDRSLGPTTLRYPKLTTTTGTRTAT